MSENYIKIMEEYLNDPNILKVGTQELREKQSEMLRTSFEHHYNNCQDYRKYCDVRDINPSEIQNLEDVYKVPLIDSFNTLRKREFFSVPKEEIKKRFSSSGITGQQLVSVSLDEKTIDWSCKANLIGFSEIIGLKPGKTLLMLPDLPHMAFSSLLKKMLPSVGHEVLFGLKVIPQESSRPKIELDMEVIQDFLASKFDVKNIFGFPFTVVQLKELIDAKEIKFNIGEDGTIMTAGGWKARDSSGKYSTLTRYELESLISDTFGVSKNRIRDIYGMTETHAGYFECCFEKDEKLVKRKHVPITTYQLVLNSDTLEPVPLGEEGIGAALDFKCYSYPGFILTDDIIKLISNDGCECGRPGQVIEYVSRVKEYGGRGCAFTVLDKLFSEEYVRASPKEPVKGGGVLEFVKERRKEIGGAEIQSNIGEMAAAMEMILEVVKVASIDKSIAESMDIVGLGKLLCYKKGEPIVMTEEELIQQAPGIPKERVKEIIRRLENVGIMRRTEKDGTITYQITEKGDELGEAIFPLFIWAMKWAEKEADEKKSESL